MHELNKQQALTFVRDRAEIFDATANQNAFASSAWFLHFIEQITEQDWVFHVSEDFRAGRSVALLHSNSKNPRKKAAVANYYASLYSPLISTCAAQIDRDRATDAIVADLVKRESVSDTIDLSPIAKDSPDTLALRNAFVRHGWYVKEYLCFGNWYLPCEGLSFAEYMRSRDPKLFNTWSRKSKKFRNSADSTGRLQLICDGDGVELGLDAYERVYARSWKKPEPYPRFVQDWARICATNGWLRLGIARLGDTPIAVQFWFTVNGRAHIFKLAYDEEYAKLSAGTVLSAFMFEHAIERDKVSEIDYLTGDDEYKKSWMPKRRERIGLLACNPTTVGGLMRTAFESVGTLNGKLRAAFRDAT